MMKQVIVKLKDAFGPYFKTQKLPLSLPSLNLVSIQQQNHILRLLIASQAQVTYSGNKKPRQPKHVALLLLQHQLLHTVQQETLKVIILKIGTMVHMDNCAQIQELHLQEWLVFQML